jgi:acyl transferase domain-containing protein
MTYYRDGALITVIGFSFRMPGGTDETLWRSLLAGVTSVESDRWTEDTLLHSNKAGSGTSYAFAAGSIGNVAGFDAASFGISPGKAEQMGPQQPCHLVELSSISRPAQSDRSVKSRIRE